MRRFYSPNPWPLYQTALILIGTCSVGILIATIFLIGTRGLAGWGAKFAFWILRSIAVCSLLIGIPNLVILIIGVATFESFSPHDPEKFWWRFIGTSVALPYFTIIVLNFVLTLHRLLVTLFPLTHTDIFPEKAAKIFLGVIWCFYIIIFLYCIFSEEPIFVFTKKELRWAVWGDSTWPVINAWVYNFKITNIVFSISIEIFFYIYWEYFPYGDGMFHVIDLASDTSFSFVMLLPYLLLNESIQKNVFKCCPKTSIEPMIIAVSSSKRKDKTEN